MVVMLAGIALLLVSFVVFIMALIKIFQDKEKNGVLHGVLSIVCGLWFLIWGWMNAERLGIKKLMLTYTLCVVFGVILYFVGAAMVVAALPEPPR